MVATRSWIAALGVVVCAVVLRAGTDLPAGDSSTPAAVGQAVRGGIEDKLNVEKFSLQDLDITVDAAEGISTVVDIEGAPVTLELRKHSVRSSVFQVLLAGANSEFTPIEAPEVATYEGAVLEIPGSRVTAFYRGGRFRAMIRTADESYTVEPLADLEIEDASAPAYVVYRASDVQGTPFTCGVKEDPQARALAEEMRAQPQEQRRVSGTGLLVVEVGIDADHSFFQENGSSVAATIDTVEDIMNAVRLDYEVAAIGMTFEITTIIVRVDPNDPYTSNNASTLLSQFQTTWNTAPENSIHRDCAKLFTGINLLPPPVGVANCIGCGCAVSSAYCLVETNGVFGFNFQVALSSHELGHVWGAFHCDGCGACSSCCRIMCSGLGGCTGIATSFGCVSTSSISSYANGGGGSCLSDLAPPQTVPFCEDWPIAVVDPSRWLFVDGAIISGSASNPPSPPFVIELDAMGGGEFQKDELRSNFINLQGQSGVVLSYLTEHVGVEAGESLIVEYRSNSKAWLPLNTITSNGTDQTQFVYHSHVLSTNAYHAEFQMRFRTTVNSTSDNWFIDDISLDCFPPPVCQEPCNDGDTCTVNDGCVEEFLCQGQAVDCSPFEDDCSTASCDPLGADGNCSVSTPANEGGACEGGSGFCSGGTCVPASASGRIFMASLGSQGAAPVGGPTTLTMAAGSTVRIGVYMEENSAPGQLLNGYQVLMPYEATALDDAPGTISYVDNDPGEPGGDSVVLDTDRPDWVFADEVAVFPVSYNETPAQGIFGLFYATIPGTGLDVSGLDGIQYLAEFDITASADADGQFEIRFNLAPQDPPVTTLFNQFGGVYSIDQTQALIVTVGEFECLTAADCGDLNGDGLRDDPCQWYDCAAGSCVQLPRSAGQADLGGFNGACAIDGACDGNDTFHALNCFSNSTTLGGPGYPCEASPPSAINVDAGGNSVSCVLDGVCDGNDAFHALNCFENIDSEGLPPYPCGCSGPRPTAPAGPVALAEHTAVLLRGPRAARAGELIDIDVYLAGDVKALRGYQLHLGVSGGQHGMLELVDMAVKSERRDYVFSAEPQAWKAFNRDSAQLVVGMNDALGLPADAGAYLATYTYRVPADAAGTFRVDLRYDGHSAQPEDRTFLFGSYARPIGLQGISPAAIEVRRARRSR